MDKTKIVRPMNPAEIVELVADYWSIPMAEMLNKSLAFRLQRVRGVAAYLIRKHTDASMHECAAALKRCNHTSIVKLLAVTRPRIPSIAAHVEQLEKIIKAGVPFDR